MPNFQFSMCFWQKHIENWFCGFGHHAPKTANHVGITHPDLTLPKKRLVAFFWLSRNLEDLDCLGILKTLESWKSCKLESCRHWLLTNLASWNLAGAHVSVLLKWAISQIDLRWGEVYLHFVSILLIDESWNLGAVESCCWRGIVLPKYWKDSPRSRFQTAKIPTNVTLLTFKIPTKIPTKIVKIPHWLVMAFSRFNVPDDDG